MPGTTSRSQTDQDRLAQGAAAVFSLHRAATLLPISDKEALVWLRQNGLVLLLAGREVVVWGDVIERLRALNGARAGAPPAARLSVNRPALPPRVSL
jgi:hypothetical protein